MFDSSLRHQTTKSQPRRVGFLFGKAPNDAGWRTVLPRSLGVAVAAFLGPLRLVVLLIALFLAAHALRIRHIAAAIDLSHLRPGVDRGP